MHEGLEDQPCFEEGNDKQGDIWGFEEADPVFGRGQDGQAQKHCDAGSQDGGFLLAYGSFVFLLVAHGDILQSAAAGAPAAIFLT
jgi:hypothetical protein